MPFDWDSSDDSWLERLREAEHTVAGGWIGPYELVSEACRGGQGVVFRAKQPGTQRHVALKRLLAGRFARAAARVRFEREINAVCALNHANIVTVYGVETIDGQPVLAMEWINGQELDAWARGTGAVRRSAHELLPVFLKICDAAQHAHQRGVIHRDLKPSNVLVDADGVPRVLDFGLALPFEDDGSSASDRLSGTAEFLGTPTYASPEQVGGDPTRVDTRTDVYSLGSILYLLLCGRPPHDASHGLAALLDAIRNDEPAAPSAVAAEGDRDLDWITLRALAKDPEKRYQSVDALSTDIRRYLAGEPVEAHPPSFSYQLRKLVRRHRSSFAFAAAVFVLIVAFGVTATTLAFRLDHERSAAIEARANEADARAAAEEVNEFLRGMLAAARPQRAQGEEITVGELVDQALERAGSAFVGRPAVEGEVRLMLGETLYGLGRYVDAEQQLERSLALSRGLFGSIHKASAEALINLAHVQRSQGRLDDASDRYHESIDAFRRLPNEQRRLADALDSLASLQMERHDLVAAEKLLEEAHAVRAAQPDADVKADVADALLRSSLHFKRGEYAAAARCLLDVLPQARTALGNRNESTLAVLNNLAIILKRQGRTAEARPFAEECVTTIRIVYGEDHPRTLQAQANFASLLQALLQYAKAEALYKAVLDHFGAQDALDDPEAIAAATNLGSLFLEQQRYEEAESLLRETLERARRIHGARRVETAIAMGLLGRAAREIAGDPEHSEARCLLTEALAIFEEALPANHPYSQKTREQLAELTIAPAGSP